MTLDKYKLKNYSTLSDERSHLKGIKGIAT